MPDKKPSILDRVDSGLKLLRQVLGQSSGEVAPAAGATSKIRLEDVTMDDLQREKVRLDQEQRKMLAQLREMEANKKKMFAEAVRNTSQREQMVIARSIKEVELRIEGMDRMMQSISKQLRTVNGLILIKERVRMQSESGLTSLIGTIDLNDLVTYVDKASVDGEFQMNKFDQVLNAMEQAENISPQYSEDQDVLEILHQIQMAQESGDDPTSLEQHFDELNRRKESGAQEQAEEDL